MSKHIGRKQQWVEVSATRFNGANGFVELNQFGMWNAVLVFKTRTPLARKGQPIKESRPWRRTTRHAGEWKRARQAMMAVENAAEKLIAEKNPDILI